MSSMVEKVAQAISTVETGGDVNWRDYVQAARAAIEAMQEPTRAAELAGSLATDGWENEMRPSEAGKVYRSMIDAALSEPSP